MHALWLTARAIFMIAISLLFLWPARRVTPPAPPTDQRKLVGDGGRHVPRQPPRGHLQRQRPPAPAQTGEEGASRPKTCLKPLMFIAQEWRHMESTVSSSSRCAMALQPYFALFTSSAAFCVRRPPRCPARARWRERCSTAGATPPSFSKKASDWNRAATPLAWSRPASAAQAKQDVGGASRPGSAASVRPMSGMSERQRMRYRWLRYNHLHHKRNRNPSAAQTSADQRLQQRRQRPRSQFH